MLKYLLEGGWMMIPLMACSLAAVAVLIDRAIAFRANARIDNRALRARVLTLLGEGKIDEAARYCTQTPGPVSAVLLVGLQSYLKHKALTNRPESLTSIMEKAMDDYAEHANSAVEKRLNVLSTVGNAAPLFGMCGTVTGMISSFRELAAAAGAGANLKVYAGLSEALVTTAVGLIIALMAVIPYHYFMTRADAISLEIEEAGTELLDFVATRVEAGPQA